MSVVTGSYAHLSPYRRHILLMHLNSRLVRLLSDPSGERIPDSGWHGHHDWTLGCRVFVIRDFMFDGDESPPLDCLSFSFIYSLLSMEFGGTLGTSTIGEAPVRRSVKW